ncbi:hypothetical protein SAMN02910384_02086 [Pseudobutyrivibrio sp. ACV-2]|nr:hypothetical protein SAMN02910384_02086 [Pseudobutyrivibrio sp. ACV-2]
MTLDEIKIKTQSDEYDFLITNEHLGSNIIYMFRLSGRNF